MSSVEDSTSVAKTSSYFDDEFIIKIYHTTYSYVHDQSE